MGAFVKFVFIPKHIGAVDVPSAFAGVTKVNRPPVPEAFANVPRVYAPPVPGLASAPPNDTSTHPWLPFWWEPWDKAASHADIDSFIAAGVVILTASPGAISEWAGEPWTTHCWWQVERDNGRPPPTTTPRLVLADFRTVRGRGRDVIELIVLPNRHRVRQTSRVRLPPFEGEIGVRATDLYQQVSAAWDEDGRRHFFVELCGKFGSVSAGDNFARIMALLKIIGASQRDRIEFDNYVDNIVSEAKTKPVATTRLRKLVAFFRNIGIELHEIFCGQQYSFLGWDIDTVRWLVIMPAKRMAIVLPRLDALAVATWTSSEDYASFKGLLTWLATRGVSGGRVSGRAQSGAAWAAGLLRRTQGSFSITDMNRTGTFSQSSLVWEGDSKCITIWGDANYTQGSRLGRAWLVASDGAERGYFLSEEWREEDEELFIAESGEDAASRRELFNYLQAVWELHMMTGCVRFCVVGDCAPACACIAKAHSSTPGMQAILDIYLWLFAERCGEGGESSSERDIFQAWFAGHPATKTAGWLVEEAVAYLDNGLAYSTSRSYASGVNRLKLFAKAFGNGDWEVRWWEPDPALLILFMSYVIGQISVGSLKVYLYGIRNFCLAHGQDDPLKNYHVERCWRGIKRSKKKGKDARLTLTVDLLERVVLHATKLLVAGGLSPRARHDLIVLCTIMVWGVIGLFRIGELVISGPKRHARVLRRLHCTLTSDNDETFLCISLDGSKTDPFRGGLDVWLADLDRMVLSPVFWFRRYESSSVSVGLNRGKAQAMFRWANGESVSRDCFCRVAYLARTRAACARLGVSIVLDPI
eukprot:g70072.t1